MATIEGAAGHAERLRRARAAGRCAVEHACRRSSRGVDLEVDSAPGHDQRSAPHAQDGPAQGVRAIRRASSASRPSSTTNERDLKRYHEASVRCCVGRSRSGRAQIGLGDARYQNDAQARASNSASCSSDEVQLAARGAAGGERAAYSRDRRARVLGQAARSTRSGSIAAVAAARAQVGATLRRAAAEGRGRAGRTSASYQHAARARSTTRRGISSATSRSETSVSSATSFASIVLRADVGITEQAWEVREEELDRVRSLQIRARAAGTACSTRSSRKSSTTAANPDGRASDG